MAVKASTKRELTRRYGIGWGPIVNGQAEIAGMPAELIEVFSKRAAQVDDALEAKVDVFRMREGLTRLRGSGRR